MTPLQPKGGKLVRANKSFVMLVDISSLLALSFNIDINSVKKLLEMILEILQFSNKLEIKSISYQHFSHDMQLLQTVLLTLLYSSCFYGFSRQWNIC